MEHRYGKPFDPFSIGRNLAKIRNIMEEGSAAAAKFAETLMDYAEQPYCRICGSGESHVFAVIHQAYEYRVCEHCGSLFMSRLPDVSKMYSDDGALNSDSYIDENVWMNRVKMIAEPKVAFIRDVVAKQEPGFEPKSALWMDIGAGGGGGALQRTNVRI